MIIIIILFLYVINTYKYQSYYITKGIVKDNFIELLVPINDLKYVTDNKQIILDGKKYSYNVNEISKDIYVDDKYNNYKYIYIDIPGLSSVNNYVYRWVFSRIILRGTIHKSFITSEILRRISHS